MNSFRWTVTSLYIFLKGNMQTKSSQSLHQVTVVFESGKTRIINVKASSKEVAERRARKRTPGAISIKRSV